MRIKDSIAEGYGRKKYKADFIKFIIYAQASCDEVLSQLDSLKALYPDMELCKDIEPEYEIFGSKINKFIQYAESNWK